MKRSTPEEIARRTSVVFDAMALGRVVAKVKAGADADGVTLTKDECARVIQAMQLLKDGPKDG